MTEDQVQLSPVQKWVLDHTWSEDDWAGGIDETALIALLDLVEPNWRAVFTEENRAAWRKL